MAAQPDFLAEVRKSDPWRHPALLFLPEARRRDVAVLLAFNGEISRIPSLIREPAPGLIRLQWWREAIEGGRPGEAASSPLAAALVEVITRHDLPAAHFLRYLDAREFDLYHDPMPDRAALETWLGETESFLFHMSARLCGAQERSPLADACGHAGVAYGAARILKLMPWHRSRQQVYLPADLLQACGLTASEWLGEGSPAHAAAIAGFAAFGREHLARAREAISGLGKAERTVFLPLSLAGPVFDRAERMGADCLSNSPEPGPLALQWAYWMAVLRG